MNTDTDNQSSGHTFKQSAFYGNWHTFKTHTNKKKYKNKKLSKFSSECKKSASEYTMIMYRYWPLYNFTSLDLGWIKTIYQLHTVKNVSCMRAEVFFLCVHQCITSA